MPDIRRKLPGRGVWTSLSAEAVGAPRPRAHSPAPFAPRSQATADLAGDVDMLLERDALQSLSMANKAGLAGRRRVQGRRRDRGWRDRCPDPGLRRRRRRGSPSANGRCRSRDGGGAAVARLNLFSSQSIGFGIREGKCDTCCSQIWRGDIGLPGAGRAAALFSRDRQGRGTRRPAAATPADGRRRRTRGRTNWLKGQPIRNGHERNEQ